MTEEKGRQLEILGRADSGGNRDRMGAVVKRSLHVTATLTLLTPWRDGGAGAGYRGLLLQLQQR